MNKYIRKSSAAISVFIALCTNSQGAEQSLDFEDEWEIVAYSPNTPDKPITEFGLGLIEFVQEYNYDELELKAKAFGNTALCVLGGLGTSVCNTILNNVQIKTNQFAVGVEVGSHVVGNLYGQGLALRNAYENEKELLKGARDK